MRKIIRKETYYLVMRYKTLIVTTITLLGSLGLLGLRGPTSEHLGGNWVINADAGNSKIYRNNLLTSMKWEPRSEGTGQGNRNLLTMLVVEGREQCSSIFINVEKTFSVEKSGNIIYIRTTDSARNKNQTTPARSISLPAELWAIVGIVIFCVTLTVLIERKRKPRW